MPNGTSTPYGEWASPVSLDMLATAGVRVPNVALDDGVAWWLERRPTEDGRGVLVRETVDGKRDVTPEGFDVRTLAHEYGGGDFLVAGGTVWFANMADQRLYRHAPGEDPKPVTPSPAVEKGDRYADMALTPDGEWLYAVRERHSDGDEEADNALVVLPADGSSEPRVVAEGHDFYSFPRPSPDGDLLSWTTWDHPSMPWDETSLHVAPIEDDGGLGPAQTVVESEDESLFQPSWSPDGTLHVVSDRTGWWNVYRVPDLDAGELDPVYPAEREFGTPQWVFGLSTYAFLDDGRIVAVYGEDSEYQLGVIDDGDLDAVSLPYQPAPHLRAEGDRVLFTAASPTEPQSVVAWRPESGHEVVDRTFDPEFGDEYVSKPEHVTFPTTDGERAHAFYYPPTNPEFDAPEDEDPPLVVTVHGGPTGETKPWLSLGTQFFTTRGFAVADVNYRGSTGYGRAYRERLQGEWGEVDVEDCVAVAEYLADEDEADGDRLAIRGGSAGGFATLAALAFHDAFDAGVSHYGVADLEKLAEFTHKFESRYLDRLVGPLPDARGTYRARSPVHHADGINAPLLLLQGSEDPVVPPEQAEQMIEALEANGTPYAYIEFEDERHGFERAESRRRAVAAELAFYGQVFGFTPDDDVEPVELRGSLD